VQNVSATTNELEEARKKRLQHKLMKDTIHDVISYLLYLMLLTAAANTTKDLQAYSFHRSLSDVFLTHGELKFDDVSLKLRLPIC